MDTVSLEVFPREVGAKPLDVRRRGFVLGEYYGLGKENESYQIDYQSFRKVYEKAGENTIIDLIVGGERKHKVLVHSVQFHPLRGTFIHVDFIHVDMKKEVTTHVPLGFLGEASAVKDLGGNLTVNRQELEVRCLPENLPHVLELDISPLVDFNTSLHVSDVVLPFGVEILDDPGLTLVSVTAPRAEEEAEPVASEESEKAEEGDGGKSKDEEDSE